MTNEQIIKKLNQKIELTATTIVIIDDLSSAFQQVVSQCDKNAQVLFFDDATNTGTTILPMQFHLASNTEHTKYKAYNTSVIVVNKNCLNSNYLTTLLRITSEYYKNKNCSGSIAIATDIESISNLFTIISHNPPLINQLLISPECAELLLNKLN